MTLDEAKTELSNAVYAAALFIERLEYAGKVSGNGHHAAQHIAKLACDELESRWRVNTQGLVTPGTGLIPEEGAASRRHQ